jgi:hypothetical protein
MPWSILLLPGGRDSYVCKWGQTFCVRIDERSRLEDLLLYQVSLELVSSDLISQSWPLVGNRRNLLPSHESMGLLPSDESMGLLPSDESMGLLPSDESMGVRAHRTPLAAHPDTLPNPGGVVLCFRGGNPICPTVLPAEDDPMRSL